MAGVLRSWSDLWVDAEFAAWPIEHPEEVVAAIARFAAEARG